MPTSRHQLDDDDDESLEASPEIQAIISRQLSAILETELQKKIVHKVAADNENGAKKIKSRVKLFSSSKHYLKGGPKAELPTAAPQVRKAIKRRQVLEGKDPLGDEEKCKTVAVTPEDIQSMKDIKQWSTRSKAPVFNYKKGNGGNLLLVEPTFR